MKLKCARDVVMDTGEVAFRYGEFYTFDKVSTFYVSTNEQGTNHYFDDYGTDDWAHWFVQEGQQQ